MATLGKTLPQTAVLPVRSLIRREGALKLHGEIMLALDTLRKNPLRSALTILGIVIAVIALNVLIRTGYGPFLRALVLGKRAGRGSTSEVLPAGAANGGRSGGGTHWADEDGRYDDTRGSRGGRQGRASPVAGHAPQPRQAPVARSRSDWR